MENRHRQITGYRDLSQDEIDAMNGIKAIAEMVGTHVQSVAGLAEVDQRWVAIARTHLQQGFMALTRAIARPTTFLVLLACSGLP